MKDKKQENGDSGAAGINCVKGLNQPKPGSHKGQNGKILIVGGSALYHGAPLLAASIASRICDLVYFSSIPENNELAKRLKSRLFECIVVPLAEIRKFIGKCDVILVGPGLGTGKEEQRLVNGLIKENPERRFVLDADALVILRKSLLNKNHIVTPHKREFKALFGIAPSREAVEKMAKKYKCTVLLKGRVDIIAWADGSRINKTGNPGMTKGGTGDVLAGLVAALYAKNGAPESATAGAYLNGLAGDRLFGKVSFHYRASDLVREIPKAIRWCQEQKA